MRSATRISRRGCCSLAARQRFRLPDDRRFLRVGEIPLEAGFSRRTRVSTLDKGITVASVDYLTPQISLNLMLRAGSVFERAEDNGVAHFLEHMHFKGTSSRSEDSLFAEVEQHGARLNAYTTRDYACFILNLQRAELAWGVELLSDMMTASRFDPALVEKEKGTILTEREESFKDPIDSLLELAHQTSFPDHAIGRPLLGSPETIAATTRAQLLEYKRAFYTGDRTLFVVSGLENHDRLAELVGAGFAPRVAATSPLPLALRDQPRPVFRPGVQLLSGSEEGKLCLGLYVEAPDWHHPDYVPILLLTRVLGAYKRLGFRVGEAEGRASPLFALAKDRPFVEQIEFMFSSYFLTGLFGVYIEGDAAHATELLEFARGFFREMGVLLTAEALAYGKSKIFSELMCIDRADDVCQDLGSYLIYLNRNVTKSELIKRFALSMDLEVIRGVVARWVSGRALSVTGVGPEKACAELRGVLGVEGQ